MSIVSWMVGTADGFLADAAESQFGAVASNTGTIVLLMVTLSLIGVCINMAFQFRSMDGASFFWYLIKLMLIGLFAFNWANFNAVSNAVIGGLDYVAAAETHAEVQRAYAQALLVDREQLDALERLLRCCARPPFAMDRLRKEGSKLVYRCGKQRSEPTSDKRGAKVDELHLGVSSFSVQ